MHEILLSQLIDFSINLPKIICILCCIVRFFNFTQHISNSKEMVKATSISPLDFKISFFLYLIKKIDLFKICILVFYRNKHIKLQLYI